MSTHWVPISVADLNDAKLGALVDALRHAALASGQTDPAPRVIQNAVNRVRRKVASHPGNRVDADPATVPAGLKDAAVFLALADMKNRLEIALTDDEVRQLARCNADLDRIADGRDTVEQADTPIPAPVQTSAGTETIQPGNAGNDRGSLRGL